MTTEELEKLIKVHGSAIYGFCLHLTQEQFLADDLYQDTLLKAVEVQHKIEINDMELDLLSAKNYVIGIAIRLWKKSKSKKYKHRFDVSLDDEQNGVYNGITDDTDVEMEIEEKEFQEHLRKAVKKLPEKLRIVVYMYYTAEMRVEEIASELHLPKGTVKSRMHLARKKIAAEMEVFGYEI